MYHYNVAHCWIMSYFVFRMILLDNVNDKLLPQLFLHLVVPTTVANINILHFREICKRQDKTLTTGKAERPGSTFINSESFSNFQGFKREKPEV